MAPTSQEDTMIEARPNRARTLFSDSTGDDATTAPSVLERCRSLFRELGERVTSFELSRQIYG